MVRMTLATLQRRILDVRQFMAGEGWKHEVYLTPTEWLELRDDIEFYDALRRITSNPYSVTITSFNCQGAKIIVPT